MKKAYLGFAISLRCSLTVAAICLLGGTPAMAVNLFWSGNGTTQGGAGTWNTSTARWGSTAGGPYGNIWNNTNIDSAEFGATAGVVNLGGPVVVNTITTTLATYAIGNTGTSGALNTITFSGANAGVNTATTGTTTINAVMSGTIVKSGPGRLEMGNIGASQPSTNKYVMNAGVISTASDARIGAAPGSLVQDFVTFNGGGWAITTGNQSTGANKGITIKSGGAFFGSSSTTINLTIASPIVGTEGGGLTLTNAGPFTGNGSVVSGVVVTLSNTSNSWDGNATVGGNSTLRIGASGVIPDAATVTVNGGNAILDLLTNTETINTLVLNSSSGRVTTTGGGGTLNATTFDVRSSNTTGGQGISAVLGGGGALTKTTGGTVLLTAVNTYSGNTTISAGTLSIDADATLGNGTGTLILNGGKLNNTANRSGADVIANPVSLTANSEVTVTTSAANPVMNFTNNSVSGDGTSTLTFRNDGADQATDTFRPRFSGSGFTLSNPIVIDNGATGKTELEFFNTGADQTISGNISGSGSINKSASTNNTGTKTILTGTNSYTGTTSINDGVLQLDGSHTGGGAYSVNDGTLQGNGSTTSAVNVLGGTLAPGASIGTLATGALAFGAQVTTTFAYELNSTTVAADLVNATGALSIANTALLSIADLGGAVLAAGTKFTMIAYTGAWDLGTFSGYADDSTFLLGLNGYKINYNDTSAGVNGGLANANYVTLTVIPELSSVLGFGLTGVFAAAAVWYGKRRGLVLSL
jgi:autotransporter-associated beta strand protein